MVKRGLHKGRGIGGLTTKVHIIVDGLGNPLHFLLSPGTRNDIVYAQVKTIQKFLKTIAQISDPRRQWGNIRYRLCDILFIAFCAILCGAETYEELELFRKSRENWLSMFLQNQFATPSAEMMNWWGNS